MKVKNLNKGSEKTKKLIRECFAIILKEKKDISKVTVKEITTLANIDRTTFYTHYSDIYDVARDFENEVLNNFFIDDELIYNFDSFTDKLFNFLDTNDELYKMILVCPETDFFMNSLKTKLITKLKNYSKADNNTIVFFSHGIVGLFINYYRTQSSKKDLNELKVDVKKLYRKLFN